MTMVSTGGYVRHRDRMVQESVYQDLRDTLIACRWMAGTTAHKVIDPLDPGAGWQILTVGGSDVLPLVGKREDNSTKAEVVLIDFFPVAGGNMDEPETPESRKTERNTLAMDTGSRDDPTPVELGSNMLEQSYVFALAFYAASDAVALAVGNDLRDRYQGRLVRDDNVDLFNYNDAGFDADTLPVVRMEVDSFRWAQDADKIAPWEVHLYFGELVVVDVVDPGTT